MFKKWILCIGLVLGLCACSNQKEFEKVDITPQELQEKLDAKEDFLLIIEREKCGYCEALDEYIENTKSENPGKVLYRLDSTDFEFEREDEDDMTLTSQTEGGKILLNMAPYFLYTPTIYAIQDGKPVKAAIGFDETTGDVSLWDVDSTIDFSKAESMGFWQYLEEYGA